MIMIIQGDINDQFDADSSRNWQNWAVLCRVLSY